MNNSILELKSDQDIESIISYFSAMKNFKEKFSEVIRRSFDEVIDGPRTRRFVYSQLEKTEKTYLGTKIEILLRTAFELEKGNVMDYVINGVEVDCKYTGSGWGWSIPREAVDHVCLLIKADDEIGIASLGIVRTTNDILNVKGNQDGKRTISAASRGKITWILKDIEIPISQLFLMKSSLREKIMSGVSGQQRLNELFRSFTGEIIERETIATVASAKDDPMKRVRANGGARSYLACEGIIILGHQNEHPRICRELGLPKVEKGQVVSARIVKDPNGVCRIGNDLWRVAEKDDDISPAPILY
ncbi:TPA: NaeI family type II restriction endonuclease [Serratia liquefaciens]